MLRWSFGFDSLRRRKRRKRAIGRDGFASDFSEQSQLLAQRRLLSIEPLEDRRLLAVLSDSGTSTLTVTLAAGEYLGVASNGGTYALTSNQFFSQTGVANLATAFTGFGSGTLTLNTLSQYSTIDIEDSGAGAAVTFNDSGTNAYSTNFSIDLTNSPATAGLTFNGTSSFGDYNLNANVASSINAYVGTSVLTDDGNITLKANTTGATSGNFAGISITTATIKSTGDGDIFLQGTGGTGVGYEVGVGIWNNSVIAVAGSGTITINGTGGSGTAGGNNGVEVRTGSLISSNTGTVSVTAAAGNSTSGTDAGFLLDNSGSQVASAGGNITLTADNINFAGPITTGSATSGTVTLQPKTAGTSIDLAGATNTLQLSTAELNAITAGTLVIGNSTAGNINVSAPITAPSGWDTLALVTGANVTGSTVNPVLAVTNLSVTAPTGIGVSATQPLTFSGLSALATDSSGSDGNQFLQSTDSVSITNLNAGNGTIDLTGGTFSLSGENQIHSSSLLQVDAGTFDVGAFNQTVAQLIVNGGTVSGMTGVLTSANVIDARSGTVGAILAGANGLTKSTSGTATLSGANTYSGGTTIDDGTLSISSDGNLGAVPASPATNITLQNGGLEATASFTLNGNRGINLTGQGALRSDDAVNGWTINGTIDGPNTLSLLGPGNIQLNGAIGGVAPIYSLLQHAGGYADFANNLTIGAGGATFNGSFELEHITLTSAGDVTFASALQTSAGGTTAVTSTGGQIAINAGAGLGNGNTLALSANTIAVGGSVAPAAGSSAVTIEPASDSTTIGVGDGASGTLSLSQSSLSNFAAGINVVIGSASQSGAITVGTNASPVTIGAPLSLQSPGSGGQIVVDGSLTETSGSLSFVAPTIGINALGVSATSSQDYNGAVTIGASTNLAGTTVTFDRTVDDTTANTDDLTVAGSAVFDDVVGATAPLKSLTVNGSGTVELNAAGTSLSPSVTTSGNQTFSENVQLGSTTYLKSSPTGGINFADTLDSEGATPENLTIDAGSGNVSFGGPVGSTNPLGTVTIVSANDVTIGNSFDAAKLDLLAGTLVVSGQIAPANGDPVVLEAPSIHLTLTAAQALGSSNVTFITDSLTLDGDLNGTGTITFKTLNAGDDIHLNGAGGGLSLDATLLAHLTGSFNKIVFGDLAASTGTFYVDAATLFGAPVEFDQLSGGGGKVFINGDLQATGGITINGSGDTTTLNANLGLPSAPLAIHDSIVLGSAALVTLLGTDVTLDSPGTISDDFADTSALDIVATGTVTLTGAIGAVPIKSLSVFGTFIVLGGGAVVTANDQLYAGDVTLAAATTLDSTAGGTTTGGNVEFTGTLDGGQALTITAGAGNVAFDDDVGTVPLSSLAVTTSGLTTFDGNVTTVNAQVFNGNVALGAGADTFTSTANAAVTFAGSVTGTANDLTIASNGMTTFGGNVAVQSLAATSTSGIAAFGPAVASVSSVNAQAYNGAVTLSTGGTMFVSIANGPLTFGGAVTGPANDLTVTSGGTTTFDGSVTVKSLTATSTSGTTSLKAGVTTTGTQTYDDLVKLLANVTLIGSTVTFANSVNGNAQSLTITGNAAFDDTVSGVTSLSVSNMAAINTTTITTTTGGQNYGGTVTLGANTTLTAPSGSPVEFNASVIGANHSLSVNGDAVLGAAATDSMTGLTTLAVTGATSIKAGNINSTGFQTYSRAVTLGNSTNLAGSTVTFMDTVSGASSLLVTGNAEFDAAVTSLTALEVTGATTIKTATITTTGTQKYDGATTLGAAATLATTDSAVTFGGTLDGNDALTIAAGLGDVTFVGNVGAGTPLGDVTVSNARNVTAKGTFQAASLTQSAAGTGTTELDGAVTVSGTAGLVLNAASINLKGPTITASGVSAPVSFTGPVTLLGNLIIDTSAGGGAVTLGGTLDSAANQNYGLTVNAGTGNIGFQQAVGGALNGALGAIAANSAGTTLFNKAVQAASIATDPAGSTQIGGDITTSGTQTYGDAVTLLAGVDLKGSIVTFANTLAGGGNSLQITGGAVFGGTVGSVSTLSVSGTAAINTTAITTTGAQTYSGTVTLGANTVLTGPSITFNDPVVGANHSLQIAGAAVFGNAASDTVTGLTTLTVTGAATINTNSISSTGTQTYSGNVTLGAGTNMAGSTVTFSGKIIGGGNSLLVSGSAVFADAEAGAVTGLTTLEVTGAATINTAASTTTGITTSGAQSFDGNVTLSGTGTVALSTTNSAVTFGGTLDGPASLTMTAGTGAITFDGNVGATTPLGDVTIASVGNLTAMGSVRAASLSQSAAGTGTTELDGTVTVSGAAGLSLDAAGINLKGPAITATGTTAAPVSFTGPTTLLGNLIIDTSAGGGAVNFNGAVNSTAGLTYGLTMNAAAGGVSFQQAVGSAAGGALGAIVVNSGGLALFGGTVQAASVATDGPGSTQIGGNVTTTGAQTYGDVVALTGAATTFASTGNAALTFGGMVTGTNTDLTVNSDGTTTFNGNVSAKSLTATSTAGTTAFGAAVMSVNSVNAQTYNDAVTLGAGATIFVSSGNLALTFDATVTGTGNDLSVSSNGTTNFKGNVSVKSLTATSTTGTTVFGSLVVSVGTVNAQTYNGAVTLSTGATNFVSRSNAALMFDGTVTGTANDLAVSSNGMTNFNGNVSVKSLTATSTSGTTAIGAAVTSVSSAAGAQTYNDAVTFAAAATTLASTGGGDITFNGTINGPVALEVDTLGNEVFNAPVGAVAALTSLTTDGSGPIGVGGQVRFNAAGTTATPSVKTTGAQTYNDAAQLGADTVLVTTGGSIGFAGTLDSDASLPRNLTLSAGSGNITFEQNIGTTHPLNNLVIQSAGAVVFDGTLAVASITQLAGTSFTFDQDVTVTGPAGVSVSAGTMIDVQGVTITTTAVNAPVSLLGPVVLSGNATITTGGGNVMFGDMLDSQANLLHTDSAFYGLTVNAAAGNVTFQGAVGSGSKGTLGNIAVNSTGITRFNNTINAASLTTNAGGLTQLNGNVTTTGAQTYNDAVEVDAAALVLAATNSPVLLAGTVNSAASASNALTINAGGGAITFQSAVGSGVNGTLGAIAANSTATTRFNSTVNAASLTTDANGLTQLNGNVTTTGAQTYGDSVEVDAAALVLATTNSPVSFAGTVNSAANVGNTASLNNALTINAGAGDVSFQQAVGGVTNDTLGAIVVNSGAATLFNGPVNAASLMTDASGLTNLSGNVITSGPQTYGDAVSLLSAVTLDSSAGNGSVTFGQTLDGAQTLTLNAGSGNILFGGMVGNGVALGDVTIANARNVTAQNIFSAASLVQLVGSGTTELDGAVTLTGNSGLALTTGSVKLNGPTITASAGPVTFNAPVMLIGNTAIDTTGGNVTFGQTLDGTYSLTVTSGRDLLFDGAVGSNSPLGAITVNSARDVIAAANITADSFKQTAGSDTTTFNGNVTASGATGIVVNASAIDLGTITLKSTDDAAPVTLHGAVMLLGNTLISTSAGSGNITFDGTLDGNQTLGLAAAAGNILFTGAVGSGSPFVSDVTIASANNVTAQSSFRAGSLTQLAGSGTTELDGPVTVNDATGLSLTTAAVKLNGGTITATFSTPAAVIFNAPVTLIDGLSIDTSAGGGNITFAKTLDGTEMLTLSAGGGDIAFNGAVGSAANGSLGALLVNSSGTTRFNAAVNAASLTTDAGGLIQLNGNVVTSGTQTYNDNVEVDAVNLALSTNNAAVLFAGTVNSVGGQASALTVNAGSAPITFQGAVGGGANSALGDLKANSTGTTRFNSTLNAASLTTDAGGLTQLGGNITTSGAQTYNDPVNLTAAANTLNATSGGNVLFANTLDGASALQINTAGTTTFAAGVGGNTPLKSLTTDAPGATAINGGSLRTTGGQTYGDNVALGADTALTSTGSGGIVFQSSLDSDGATPRNLSVSTGGGVAFGDGNGADAVGRLHPLASLTVAGNTSFQVAGSTALAPSVTTTGGQTYNGPVTLLADTALTTLAGGGVSFGTTVDSSSPAGSALIVDTTGGRLSGAFGLTQFNGSVGGGGALKSLTVTTGGPFAIKSGVSLKAAGDVRVVVAENNAGVAGDDLNVQSGGTLQSTAGNISLLAGDNISVDGNLSAAGNVTLAGDYNNNDPTAGTTISVAGNIQAASVNVTGGSGGDTINLSGVLQAPSVTVNDGAGNDTVNVQKTVSGTTTTINSGPGGDQINVSSSAANAGGMLANIAGKVVVSGGAGDVMNVYDNGDANASATGDLTSSSLTGFGMGAGITYQGGLKTVNLRLGSGPNLALNVHSTAATTPVYVVGQGVGAVNVGDNNQIAGVAGTLDVTGVQALNVNDQNSSRGQTYVITNESVARPGTPLQVLMLYHKVGTVAINSGNQAGGQLVDDTFNLFLPSATDLPLSATLKFDGGVSPGGYHNTLNVVASQSTVPTGFTYHAHVGLFGSQDPIQIQNVQVLHMYGSPVDTNDLANDTSASSVIIGGTNADTLSGGLGQDVIFGGGDTAATGDQLFGGGGGSDFVFAEFHPQFNADGSVSFTGSSGSGNTVINAGGGAAVSLTPETNINNASSVIQVNGRIDVVTWLTARFASPSSVGSIFQQALSTDPVLSGLQAPPNGPAPVPVATLAVGPTTAALNSFVNSAFQDVLGRMPDANSLDAAVNDLADGIARGAFASGLTHSPEYYATNVIIPAYKNYLNRAPDAAGLAFWTQQLQNGLTDEQLEASFISSDEFYATQGHGTDAGWVDALYMKLLNRPAEDAGMTYWLAKLAGGESRGNVALSFTASLEREAQRVTYDYQHYLNRAPEQQGIAYWVQQFADGFTNEDLVAGFVSSDEYFADHS